MITFAIVFASCLILSQFEYRHRNWNSKDKKFRYRHRRRHGNCGILHISPLSIKKRFTRSHMIFQLESGIRPSLTKQRLPQSLTTVQQMTTCQSFAVRRSVFLHMAKRRSKIPWTTKMISNVSTIKSSAC